jgi:hypothetical protein
MDGIQQALTTLVSGREQFEMNTQQQNIVEDTRAQMNRVRDTMAFLERARSGALAGYEGQGSAIDQQLEKSRAELLQLQATSDAISAKTKESVMDLIKRTAGALGETIAVAMRDALTKNLAEQAISALGGLGGGLGGMFSSLLGIGGTPGQSKENPMWIKDADAAGGDAVSKAKDALKDSPLGKVFDEFKEKAKTAFGDIGTKIMDMLGSFGGGLKDVFSSIFDALSGGGGGEWMSAAGSFIGSLFHSGGVVGSSFTPRYANPLMFAQAARYHTGGIAGLQPNEVPAILMRGEEVLTANDPRHRNNGGGAGGDTINANVTVNMETGENSAQADGETARAMGERLKAVVVAEIINQKRPGGILA